jgi:hypothetical protein
LARTVALSGTGVTTGSTEPIACCFGLCLEDALETAVEFAVGGAQATRAIVHAAQTFGVSGAVHTPDALFIAVEPVAVFALLVTFAGSVITTVAGTVGVAVPRCECLLT